MILIIVEKFSVAMQLASSLGVIQLNGKPVKRSEVEVKMDQLRRAYGGPMNVAFEYKGEDYVLTWAAGHLVELKHAYDYIPEYKVWSNIDFPFFPEVHELQITRKYENGKRTEDPDPHRKRLIDFIESQAKQADWIINGLDADREGDLIFAYIMDYIKCNKPFKKLFIKSTEETALRDSFENLLDPEPFVLLGEAGKARSASDMDVGINITSLMQVKYSNGPLLSFGRVQTAVLNMIVKRENEIMNFVSEPFWSIDGNFKNDKGELLETKHERGRTFDKSEAEKWKQFLDGKDGVVESVIKKETKGHAPMLFDLDYLSREANKKYKMTTKATSEAMQSLYDKGYVSYPRTDSRHLPEDMKDSMNNVFDLLAGLDDYKDFVVPKENRQFHKRHYDTNKASSHHAIVPTVSIPDISSLNEAERNIYDLVVRSALKTQYEPALFNEIDVVVDVEGEKFKAKGKSLKEANWMTIDGTGNDKLLADVNEGDVLPSEYILKEGATSAPKRYTESTLSSDMANVSIEDEDMLKAIEEGSDELEEMVAAGIGRPSTRSAIISTVIDRYCTMDKMNIVPTKMAMKLMDVFPIEELKDPVNTAKWEIELDKVAEGEKHYTEFIYEMQDNIREWVKIIEEQAPSSPIFSNGEDTEFSCPHCNSPVVKVKNMLICSARDSNNEESCQFLLPAKIGNIKVSKKDIRDIMTKKKTGLIENIKTKDGKKKYSCYLIVSDNGSIKMSFKSDLECPKCKSKGVKSNLMTGNGFFNCEKRSSDECDFFMPMTIAGKKLSENQISELISNGKLESIKGFQSKKGNKFDAGLVFDDDYRIKFDIKGPEKTGIKCPKCEANGRDGEIYNHPKFATCQYNTKDNKQCDFFVYKIIANKKLTESQVNKLITTGSTDTIKGFKSKKGNDFSCKLALNEDFAIEFVFEEPKSIDCPLCKKEGRDGKLIIRDKLASCSLNRKDNKICDMFIYREMAGHYITDKEIDDLLKKGKTDLINDFISKKGSKFSAFIVLDEDFKTSFEFLPRK